MPDWYASMQQTFEYYTVDPGTWKEIKRLDNVKSSSITRDADTETLGSATFEVTDSLGECHIRIYLVTIQNGIIERFPLGTFLVQSPSSTFDGKSRSVSMDAYTPLIELKENRPPIGYFIPKGEETLTTAYKLVREHVRAPVTNPNHNKTLYYDFVATTDDTWMTFITDLIASEKYTFSLEETGRILFAPKQDLEALQPIWTFDDSNSSILYPELTMDHDLYGIPNVVEGLYSKGSEPLYARVVNDDSNSPVSTVNRGREILHRVIDPDFTGNPNEGMIEEYAEQLLKELSTLEYSVSYTHGYCPVRLGDCVRLNYARAGLNNVRAKVVSQTIKCTPGCPVTEKAIFTHKLWR